MQDSAYFLIFLVLMLGLTALAWMAVYYHDKLAGVKAKLDNLETALGLLELDRRTSTEGVKWAAKVCQMIRNSLK